MRDKLIVVVVMEGIYFWGALTTPGALSLKVIYLHRNHQNTWRNSPTLQFFKSKIIARIWTQDKETLHKPPRCCSQKNPRQSVKPPSLRAPNTNTITAHPPHRQQLQHRTRQA